MTPFLSELASTAGSDRRVGLDDDIVAAVRAKLEGLPIVPPSEAGRDTCWACAATDAETMDYVILLGGNAEDLTYVVSSFAIRGTEIRRLSDEFRAMLGSLMTTAATLSAFGVTDQVFRCTHTDHPSIIHRCNCGSPDDFVRWSSSEVCLFSNCYNFAVRDVWCSDGEGAKPRSLPDDLGNHSAWADILEADGLLHIPTFPIIPSNVRGPGGWPVALAVTEDAGTPYHFLRLDGDRWVHKFGKRPPQVCDTAGQPIPEAGIRDANLCGYTVLTFFWVPQPLRINR